MASAPDTVTEMRSSKAKIHSAVPPITPSMARRAGRRARILKCALTMARNSSGAVRPGTRSLATQGGTASTTAVARRQPAAWRRAIPAPSPCAGASVRPRSRVDRLHLRALARPDRPAPDRRRPPPGSAGRCGGDRRPPLANVSRSTAPASAARKPSGLGVQRRQQEGMHQPVPQRARSQVTTSPMRALCRPTAAVAYVR